jgi:hypothetical protein
MMERLECGANVGKINYPAGAIVDSAGDMYLDPE